MKPAENAVQKNLIIFVSFFEKRVDKEPFMIYDIEEIKNKFI